MKNLLSEKTERTEEEFNKFLNLLYRKITIILAEEFESLLGKAKEISPDIKDIPYIALALKLNIPIWSNDKKLKENQNIIKVYNTADIIRLF